MKRSEISNNRKLKKGEFVLVEKKPGSELWSAVVSIGNDAQMKESIKETVAEARNNDEEVKVVQIED